MKVIRKGVFETNSSSTHSFSLSLSEEWDCYKDRLDTSNDDFLLLEEVIDNKFSRIVGKNILTEDSNSFIRDDLRKQIVSNIQKLDLNDKGFIEIYPGQEVWVDNEYARTSYFKASLVLSYILCQIPDCKSIEKYRNMLVDVIRGVMGDISVNLYNKIRSYYDLNWETVPEFSAIGSPFLEEEISDIIASLFGNHKYCSLVTVFYSDEQVYNNLKLFIFNPEICLTSFTGMD